MPIIQSITAREIINSKAVPTVETTVALSDGTIVTGSCPTGTSIGSYEATDLRDEDENRYGGKGVLKAVANIKTTIAQAIVGKEIQNFSDVDKILLELDATQNKSVLGANAILSVSITVARACARSAKMPLYKYLHHYLKQQTNLRIPTPIFNIINGGEHAGNNVDFQEFMVIPASSMTFSSGLLMCTNIYHALKNTLKKNGLTTLVGDEGGFGPTFPKNTDALAMLKKAIDTTSAKFGYDIFFGLDVASNSFYHEHTYHVKDNPNPLSTNEIIAYFREINKEYALVYLEDPLAEDDWDGWSALCKEQGQDTLIVGDDLTATNPYRLQIAINKKAITGIIIKPNQIGTVLESLAVVEVARAAGLKIIVSHRSGETNDDFIADFAVATAADYVKFGAPARGERIAKYNRLLAIEGELLAETRKA